MGHRTAVLIRQMKNSGRAQGCSGPGAKTGHELLIRCSAHFAREGRADTRRFTDGGTKSATSRRNHFRKGTCKANQVRCLSVDLEECFWGEYWRPEARHVLRSCDAQVVCKKPVIFYRIWSFLRTLLILRLIFQQRRNFPISQNVSEGRAGVRQFS